MPAIDIKSYAEDAIAEVLEAMCFIDYEGCTDDETGQYKVDWLSAEVDFAGPARGTFGIAAPARTAAVMAANFLGDDESVLTNEQTVEVMCELANMICGALLSRLNPHKAFTLSSPRHCFSDVHGPADAELISGSYRLDEGFIYCRLNLRESA